MEPPPILQIPGLKLVEWGEDKGRFYMKYIVHRRRVREITVYVSTKGPVEWLFEYSMWDASTRTVVSYKGKHGDPTKDRRTEIRGIE
jgi:hypothetical protein